MKRCFYVCMSLFPLAALSATLQTLEIPKEASDSVDAVVNHLMPNTIVLSGTIVTVVQVLKKVMASLRVEISGIKSQVLAVFLATLYAALSVDAWNTGEISSQDVVIIIQSVISAIGGIYSYKILWKLPAVSVDQKEKGEVSK